jgi:hypothetical protein
VRHQAPGRTLLPRSFINWPRSAFASTACRASPARPQRRPRHFLDPLHDEVERRQLVSAQSCMRLELQDFSVFVASGTMRRGSRNAPGRARPFWQPPRPAFESRSRSAEYDACRRLEQSMIQMIASSASWKRLEPPIEREDLELDASFSDADAERIMRGLSP